MLERGNPILKIMLCPRRHQTVIIHNAAYMAEALTCLNENWISIARVVTLWINNLKWKYVNGSPVKLSK